MNQINRIHMKRVVIIETVRFLFIVLFLYAAGTKLTDYDRFIVQVGKSPLLTSYADYIAWMIPCNEIVVAVLLILPRTRLLGMHAAFGLMAMFTFYIAAILSFSEELPCSCGGVLNSLGWKEHLVFNIVFTSLSIAGIILMRKEQRHHTEFTT